MGEFEARDYRACRRCRPLPDRARLLKRVSCSARKLAPEFQGAPDDKPRPPAPRDRSAQARSTATRSLSHRPPPRMHMSASSEASVTPPADRKFKVGHRFRGFLPVVVDVETGGFNSQTDALLEIAAVILGVDEHGKLFRRETSFAHVTPFPGANIEKAALEVTGIRIDSPLRLAMAEKDALDHVFRAVRRAV